MSEFPNQLSLCFKFLPFWRYTRSRRLHSELNESTKRRLKWFVIHVTSSFEQSKYYWSLLAENQVVVTEEGPYQSTWVASDSTPKNARIAHIYSFIAILWLTKFRWRRNTAIYLINCPPISSDAEPSHACLVVPPSVTGMAPAAGEESGDPGRRKACVVVLGDLGWNRCLYRERLSDISILRCRRDPSIYYGNAVKCQSVCNAAKFGRTIW